MTSSIVLPPGCPYPGPYQLEFGTDGVDETLDIVPFGSNRPIASMHFWMDGDGNIPPHVLATGKLLAASAELFDIVKRLSRVADELLPSMSDDAFRKTHADAVRLIARIERTE